ncbi:MAG: PIN domain-containing protein, partial [Ginsengibacter sp.]
MAYKIFVDSDVFLDILLIRQPHFESSVSIFYLRNEQKVELFTAPSIILNINYIAQKQLNKEKALK